MKKLSKIALVILVLSFPITTVNAQGLYLNVGLGYNLAAGKQLIGTNTTSSSIEGVYGSYGKGISPDLGVGFMFSEHVGAELGFSYLLGGKYETTDNDGSTTSTTEAKAKMLRIIPAIRVTTGETVKPYARFGIVIGMMPKADVEETGSTTVSGFGSTSFTNTDKYTGGSSIGFLGAAGVDFKLSDMLAIYAELNSITQSWAPNKRESTMVSSAGGVSVSESSTTNFEDNVPDNSTGIGLKYFEPFSSFGIHAGVKLMFGGK